MSSRSEVLIVTSENFHAIARLPRFLDLAGWRVSALTPRGSVLAASSRLAARLPAPSDADGALEALRRHLDGGARYDWIILGDDAVLTRAIARRSEPWLARALPVLGGAAAAEPLVSKVAFSRAMEACGVPMPPARAARGAEQIRAAAAALGLPVIVKPDLGYAGVGLFAVRTAAELEKCLAAADGDYIVERLVDGRLGATAVLFNAGKPSWWASFGKAGVFPAPYGPSARRVALEPPGLEPLLERMGAALGLDGLFGVDWFLTSEGKTVVIELNGRPVAMILGSRHVSEGFPAALRDRREGRASVRRPPPDYYEGVWHAMPASFSLACSERRWALAAGLLFGLAGATDTPWEDFGLLKNHAARMAKTLIRTAAALCYERLPRPLQRVARPAGGAALALWRRAR